jgi:hypothetical protein
MTHPGAVDTWLTDMDGVLVHEDKGIPGAADFIARLTAAGRRFLVRTNKSIYTPRDLRARLLDSVGIGMTRQDPDYVVLGETRTYSFEAITAAIQLLERDARSIATNPDPTGPSLPGSLPATGSVAHPWSGRGRSPRRFHRHGHRRTGARARPPGRRRGVETPGQRDRLRRMGRCSRRATFGAGHWLVSMRPSAGTLQPQRGGDEDRRGRSGDRGQDADRLKALYIGGRTFHS